MWRASRRACVAAAGLGQHRDRKPSAGQDSAWSETILTPGAGRQGVADMLHTKCGSQRKGLEEQTQRDRVTRLKCAVG